MFREMSENIDTKLTIAVLLGHSSQKCWQGHSYCHWIVFYDNKETKAKWTKITSNKSDKVLKCTCLTSQSFIRVPTDNELSTTHAWNVVSTFRFYDIYYACVCVCVCVYVCVCKCLDVCTWVHYPQRPWEGFRSPGAGVNRRWWTAQGVRRIYLRRAVYVFWTTEIHP